MNVQFVKSLTPCYDVTRRDTYRSWLCMGFYKMTTGQSDTWILCQIMKKSFQTCLQEVLQHWMFNSLQFTTSSGRVGSQSLWCGNEAPSRVKCSVVQLRILPYYRVIYSVEVLHPWLQWTIYTTGPQARYVFISILDTYFKLSPSYIHAKWKMCLSTKINMII